MPKKIEIKPNDQSVVGVKLQNGVWTSNSWIQIKYVGERVMVGNWDSGKEDSCYISGDWYLYEEPKKYKIVSPAVICERFYQITTEVYETEQKARLEWPTFFHSWPACDANGNPIQYRVEVKE